MERIQQSVLFTYFLFSCGVSSLFPVMFPVLLVFINAINPSDVGKQLERGSAEACPNYNTSTPSFHSSLICRAITSAITLSNLHTSDT